VILHFCTNKDNNNIDMYLMLAVTVTDSSFKGSRTLNYFELRCKIWQDVEIMQNCRNKAYTEMVQYAMLAAGTTLEATNSTSTNEIWHAHKAASITTRAQLTLDLCSVHC
jgi:hypothetical protein